MPKPFCRRNFGVKCPAPGTERFVAFGQRKRIAGMRIAHVRPDLPGVGTCSRFAEENTRVCARKRALSGLQSLVAAMASTGCSGPWLQDGTHEDGCEGLNQDSRLCS